MRLDIAWRRMMTNFLLIVLAILLIIDIVVRLKCHHTQKLHVKSLKDSLEKCCQNLYLIHGRVDAAARHLSDISVDFVRNRYTEGGRWR